VPTVKLVRHASKLENAASDIATKLAAEYGFKVEERRQCIRNVRMIRMEQQNMSHQICRQWPWNGAEGQLAFMECLVDDHSSESDE